MQIDLINFTPYASFLGGMLLGLSGILLLNLFGRIAGISGILGGALTLPKDDTLWRLYFLFGLFSSGLIASVFMDLNKTNYLNTPMYLVIFAGLLVGFGTRLGSGCTSGHGICGISRLSFRSVIATGAFLISGVLTVLVMNNL